MECVAQKRYTALDAKRVNMYSIGQGTFLMCENIRQRKWLRLSHDEIIS